MAAPLGGVDDPNYDQPYDPKSRPGTGPRKRFKELGWEDPVLKTGRWRPFYYLPRERDPYFFQPTITESVVSPNGMEQQRSTEMYAREKPSAMSHEEWRDRRYFLDPNIKAIYEKYPISRQHPGMGFRLSGLEHQLVDKNYMPGYMPTAGFIREWPGIMPQGWKFMAAPFGEQCHVKTAVCAKYGLMLGSIYFLYKAPMFMLGRGWKYMLKQWYMYNSYTVPAGAAWAAASCISCSIRKKDDFWNMFAGGTAFGSIIGMRKGFFHGWQAAILASIFGTVWYYIIANEGGFASKSAFSYQDANIFSWDPACYKWVNWETKKYDKQPWNF